MTSPSDETQHNNSQTVADAEQISADGMAKQATDQTHVKELGGPKGPEPTRFGDWERKGRCVDF